MTIDPTNPRPPQDGQPGQPSTHTPPPPAYVAHDEPRKPADGMLINGAPPEEGRGSNVNRYLVISLVIVSLIAIGLLIHTFMGDSDDANGGASPTDPSTSQQENNTDDDASATPSENASETDAPSDDPATDNNGASDPATDPNGNNNGGHDPADLAAAAKALPNRSADLFWAEGSPDAKVVLTEFADFRCIHCAHWFFDVHPQLKSMIDDGTLRVEARAIPLFGAESIPAVVAAWVAGEQGKYFEYASELFSATVENNAEVYTEDGLKSLAEKVGLDKEKFSAEFDAVVDDLSAWQQDQSHTLAPSTQAMVDQTEENFQAFQSLGFTGTPAFVVGEQVIKGAVPFEQFQQVIDQELAK